MGMPDSQGAKLRWQQVIADLEHAVRTGKYLPGHKLPSLKEMSGAMGLNHLTVRKAVLALAEKGVLEVRPSVGTFVSEKPVGKLQKHRTTKIVLACPDFMRKSDEHHPSIGAYLHGAYSRCRPPEFAIQPLFFRKDRFIEDIGTAIATEEVHGVITTDGCVEDAADEFLRAHKVDVVESSLFPVESSRTTVCLDTAAALRRAIEHLCGLGHSQIAFVAYEDLGRGNSVYRAFAQAILDHQLGDPQELLVLIDNPAPEVHWEDIEKLFEMNPLPTGVIVWDEFAADFLLRSCERRGVRVPGDLSVVAVQDVFPYGHRIPLTSCYGTKKLNEMVYVAADVLIQLISGQIPSNRNVTIPIELRAKASTRPVETAIGSGAME